METPANYPELVAKAEKAVAAVKDPELKRIAFQKILDDLLANPTTGGQTKAPQKARKAPSARRSRAAKSGPQAYVEELVTDGFFKRPKSIAQVRAELENRGHHIPVTALSGPLQKLCQRKVLRRQRVKTSGNKLTFAYSNY